MAMTNTEILNQIWNGASPNYQDNVPQATRDNIALINNALETYQPLQNEFLNALINKIGLQIINVMSFDNPLSRFKGQMLRHASDIEDIWVDEAKTFEYNEKGDKIFTVTKPNVRTIYHRQDRKLCWKVTIYERQIAEALTNEYGLQSLLDSILSTLSTADQVNEFVMMKQLLADYLLVKNGYYNITVPTVTDQDSADVFMTTLKKISRRLTFPAKNYNKQKVLNKASIPEQVLIINSDVYQTLDVMSLAKAFNQSNTDFITEVIQVDDFGDMPNTAGLIIDKKLWMVHDTLMKMTSFYNPEGLYWNYWLHHWQSGSMSQWHNAIRLTYNDTVDGVDSGLIIRQLKSGKINVTYKNTETEEEEKTTYEPVDVNIATNDENQRKELENEK